MTNVQQLITNTNDNYLAVAYRCTYGEPEDEKVIQYKVGLKCIEVHSYVYCKK